jgi:hypothetical protein
MREYHVRRGTDVKDARSRGVRRVSRAWIGAAAGRGEVRAGQREDDDSHEGAVCNAVRRPLPLTLLPALLVEVAVEDRFLLESDQFLHLRS